MNMFPRLAYGNLPNRPFGDTKSLADFFYHYALLQKTSDLTYIVIRQFCHPLASAVRLAHFIISVLHVVLMGAKEKMVIVPAFPVFFATNRIANIAFVTNAHPFWNGAAMNFPTHTVVVIGYAPDIDLPVPIPGYCSSPGPTSIGVFWNNTKLKKLILDGWFAVKKFVGATTRAESIVVLFDSVHVSLKNLSTIFAGFINGWIAVGIAHSAPPAVQSWRCVNERRYSQERVVFSRRLAAHRSLYPITTCPTMEGQKAKTA